MDPYGLARSWLTSRSPDSGTLFSALEAVVDQKNWSRIESTIATQEKQHFLEMICSKGWVSQLVTALEKLVAASVSNTLDTDEAY